MGMNSFCEQANILECRSCHLTESPKPHHSELTSKSDLNFISTQCLNVTHRLKYYELDEIPVKDSGSYKIIPKSKESSSLCDSDLDRLEKRIYNNVSQELQTDESSFSSLDTNIKFFKSTVEKIFDNFYTSMSDFDQYKKRFNDIIAKCKEGSVDDMEDFIKDMFENILSGESSVHSAYKAGAGALSSYKADIGTSSCGDGDTTSLSIEPDLFKHFEEDKNSNSSDKLEAPSDANSSKLNATNIDEIFNIFLVGGGGNQSLEIKLNCRAMLSEVQMKEPGTNETETTASADNLKKLAAKKLQVERYITQALDQNAPDRNIPVKISFPKKDIHLNEDFNARMADNGECTKSFMGKICSLLCKKFRKSTIG